MINHIVSQMRARIKQEWAQVQANQFWDTKHHGRIKIIDVLIEDAVVEFSNGRRGCLWLGEIINGERLHLAGKMK